LALEVGDGAVLLTDRELADEVPKAEGSSEHHQYAHELDHELLHCEPSPLGLGQHLSETPRRRDSDRWIGIPQRFFERWNDFPSADFA